MNFPQTASYNTFCRCIQTLIDLQPIDKLKLAFEFYAHKYDDKITTQDAMTIMTHLTPFDFLLQKDLKQIFKALYESKSSNKLCFISPKQSWKSVERNYDDSKSSPEKEVFVIPKIVKRRKVRSKRRGKKGLGSSLVRKPHIKVLEQQSYISSPSKTIATFDSTSSVQPIKNYAKNAPLKKGFLEYASDVYAKLLRINKNKNSEENHPGPIKAKNIFNSTRTSKVDNSLIIRNNDECRRGLSVLNLHDISPNE